MDLYKHFTGDSFEHNNAIFEEYKDICRIEGGVDHLWSVGTDTRQLSLLDSGWQSSESMREMLNDDVQRRYYILDGDIEVIISIMHAICIAMVLLDIDFKTNLLV